MSAKIVDGRKLAAAMRAEIAEGVAALKAERGVTPGLAVILVGEDPASVSYVTAKEKACREVGMHSREIRLPANTPEDDVLAQVRALNADPAIHGILAQLRQTEKQAFPLLKDDAQLNWITEEQLNSMLDNYVSMALSQLAGDR